jgi:hypothetical protein
MLIIDQFLRMRNATLIQGAFGESGVSSRMEAHGEIVSRR